MNTDPLPNGGTAWRTEQGRLGIWPARSGVLVVALKGHGAREFARPILEAYDQIARPDPVHLFFDFEDLLDYAPPLRTELVLHFIPDRQRIRAAHLLLRPQPSGTMMAAAINAFRRIVDVVEDRAHFEALLDARLAAEGIHDFSSSSLRQFR